MKHAMEVEAFFDPSTSTMTYLVFHKETKDAVIIDAVLDFDPASVSIKRHSIEALVAFIKKGDLRVHYILETHAHADHISGAHELVTRHFPHAQIGIGERITAVQKTFGKVFNFSKSFKTDGSQFHRLFKKNEVVSAGSLSFQVLFTPGHTPACVSYLFGETLFTGDALFMPDSGTGRCDFPQGDARTLFGSIKLLYALPEQTRVFVGHDYQPGGREVGFQTTIGESKQKNIHLKAETSEEEFVTFRNARDATLAAPRLLYPSIQVNITAGYFPEAESNGIRYLKLPLKLD